MSQSNTPLPQSPRFVTLVASLQGTYFFLFGLWPIVHIPSFLAVTGEKTDHLVTGREGDHWLVITVGTLVTVIGAALLVAAWRKSISAEVVVLAIGGAGALAVVDVTYVVRRVIPPIYLADAAVEAAFILAWLAAIALQYSQPRGGDVM